MSRSQHHADDDPRYAPEVLRRFETLQGVGKLEPEPDVIHGSAGDAEQGASIELDARIVNGRVAEARFLVFGCPHLVAAASWLVEQIVGFDQARLDAWDWQEAVRALEIPPAKYARLLTLQDAVRDLARNWPGAPGLRCRIFQGIVSRGLERMAISLTPPAAESVRTFLQTRGKGVGLRLGVKKTGCSGFAYVVSYADEVGAGDVVLTTAASR